MTVSSMLDSAGRRRSPATLPGFHSGRAPRNKGMLYPADPPTVEEIVCVMRHASNDSHGWRLRAMMVMPGANRPGRVRLQGSSPSWRPRPRRSGRSSSRRPAARIRRLTSAMNPSWPPSSTRPARASLWTSDMICLIGLRFSPIAVSRAASGARRPPSSPPSARRAPRARLRPRRCVRGRRGARARPCPGRPGSPRSG
jgi:hypothetical protein